MAEVNANVVENNMIGNIYPFYLNNSFETVENQDKEYLLYQISSPSLSPNLVPYITFSKIGERTSQPLKPKDKAMKHRLYSNDGIIFAYCNKGTNKDLEELGFEFVTESLKKFEVIPEVVKNGRNFPLIELQPGCNIQKNLLISLRNSLRWTKYKFSAGCFIDILWTPTTFIKFKICGDNDVIWLEPEAAYKLTDVEMANPLPVKMSTINYPKVKYSKDRVKISEFNTAIRLLEWKSFDRQEFSI